MTTPEQIAATLESAKSLLLERGWVKGAYEAGDGCLCSLGAIHAAVRRELGIEKEEPWSISFYGDSAADDVARVRYLDAAEELGRAAPGGSAWQFNDLPTTELDGVLAMFDRAIASQKEAA